MFNDYQEMSRLRTFGAPLDMTPMYVIEEEGGKKRRLRRRFFPPPFPFCSLVLSTERSEWRHLLIIVKH
ncbi:hypothetical protein AGMMS50239_22250 [Bacteroidia bacterium]|nr:hypothetical protein AGMMS50239_22250 [Bacteroidia bacterium]